MNSLSSCPSVLQRVEIIPSSHNQFWLETAPPFLALGPHTWTYIYSVYPVRSTDYNTSLTLNRPARSFITCHEHLERDAFATSLCRTLRQKTQTGGGHQQTALGTGPRLDELTYYTFLIPELLHFSAAYAGANLASADKLTDEREPGSTIATSYSVCMYNVPISLLLWTLSILDTFVQRCNNPDNSNIPINQS